MTLDGVAERGGAVSADGVRESVSEEVTFELRPEKLSPCNTQKQEKLDKFKDYCGKLV